MVPEIICEHLLHRAGRFMDSDNCDTINGSVLGFITVVYEKFSIITEKEGMCDHNNSPEIMLGRSELCWHILSLNKDGGDNHKCFCIKVYSGGSKGGPEEGVPNSFNSMQFWGKFAKSYVGAPSSGKSWIRHWCIIVHFSQQLM